MKKIGLIGFGYMGSAFAEGLKKSKEYNLVVSEIKDERIKLARDKYKLEVFTSNKELIEASDIIILAIKPQELMPLFREAGNLTTGKKFISIIAGKTIEYIQNRLNALEIARFMPNLAAQEKKALVGISFSEQISAEFKKDCLDIAQAIGTPCELPESLMPAVTGLSGSGIAFVFAFLHALALGGVEAGIPYPKALEIALVTVDGAVATVRNSGLNPVALLSQVISPAGTTIKGVAALEKNGFTYSIMSAVQEAAKRAAELEG
jgi:pyrroline-5-carboxylate reductase